MSGLFVRPPADLSNPYSESADTPPADDLQAKIAFEEEASRLFNRVICEFCLGGIVSQPTSPVHVSYARLIDGHVLITGGGGGREYYEDRSSGPALDLIQARWLSWAHRPETFVHDAMPLRRAARLADISETLPEFVAGAYSLFSQRQINEALIDAWVVCEQLVDYLWQQYRGSLPDSSRRKRLGDSRTYSVAVRLELLKTVGVLPDALYEALNLARDHRNELVHRATADLKRTTSTIQAMTLALAHVLGEGVAHADVSTGVNW